MNFRQSESQTIISLIAEDALPSSILVLGPSSSGKFSTVNHCLKLVRHPSTTINCLGCYNPRSVFEGILLNLLTKDGNDSLSEAAAASTCKSGAQFCRQLCTTIEQCKLKSLIIVLRNADKLLEVLDSSTLSLMARLREHTKFNICCLFISTAPVQKFFARPDFQSIVITFRPYMSEQLVAICKGSLMCPANMPVSIFDWFVEFLFRSVQSITQDLVEIRYLMAACLPRFHKMFLDLSDNTAARSTGDVIGSPTGISSKNSNQAMAFAQLHKQLAIIVELVCQHGIYTRCLNDPPVSNNNECAAGLLGFLPAGPTTTLLPAEVALSHLSAQSKLLLISAFVAAKNAPSSDRLLFESKTSKAENRLLSKQRRRNERAKTANVNPTPQPPRMFRLRRLVSIYQYFASQASVCNQNKENEEEGDVSDVISSDVMNAITSLVDLRLLSAAKSKDALANPAYYCSLLYEDVTRLAKSVKIMNLEAYLDDFGAGGGAAFDDS